VVIVNPKQRWTVDRDLVLSRSSNTPYHGYELPGVVTHTFFKGRASLLDANIMQVGGL
jgi:dihydroorotase